MFTASRWSQWGTATLQFVMDNRVATHIYILNFIISVIILDDNKRIIDKNCNNMCLNIDLEI